MQERYRSDPNEGLLMPISTVIQTLYEEEPSVYMVVHVTDANRIDEAKEQITNYLREQHQIEQDAEGNYQDDFDMPHAMIFSVNSRKPHRHFLFCLRRWQRSLCLLAGSAS